MVSCVCCITTGMSEHSHDDQPATWHLPPWTSGSRVLLRMLPGMLGQQGHAYKNVRGICLTLVSFSGQDETMIAVGLGYSCHLTIKMSQILWLPLRHPMENRSSRSIIYDQVHSKLADKDREWAPRSWLCFCLVVVHSVTDESWLFWHP